MDEGISTGASQSVAPASTADSGSSASSSSYSSSTGSDSSHSSATSASATTSSSSSSSGSGDKVVASTQATKSAPAFVLVEGSDGRRRLKPASAQDNNSSTPTPTEWKSNVVDQSESLASKASETAQQMQKEPAKYNIDEFSRALATGQVDERRVPTEYVKQYNDWKLGQAVQRYNAQQQALQQKQAELNKRLTPQEQSQQMQKFLNNLNKEAESRAAKDADLSTEDLEMLDLIDDEDPKKINFQLAKEWRRQEIMQELQQRYTQEAKAREKQASIYQNIKDFAVRAKEEEPNFDAIDVMMQTRYRNMPYEQGRKIEPILKALTNGTITEAQAASLRQYYEDTRKEFYAQKNGLSTTPRQVARPPITERSGDGRSASSNYSPDYKALGQADVRGRRAWLSEYLRNRGR